MLQSLALTTAAAAIAPVSSALAGTTPDPAPAVDRGVDLDARAIQVGSVVYVGEPATGLSDAEGLQVVASIDGDLLTGHAGDPFQRSAIENHLAGVLIRDGSVINGADDRVLVAMGLKLEALLPRAQVLWEEQDRLRLPLVAAFVETDKSNMGASSAWRAIKAMHPAESAAYDVARDRFNVEAGNLTYMLIHCIGLCRAHTPWGVYYRNLAQFRGLLDDMFVDDGEQGGDVG